MNKYMGWEHLPKVSPLTDIPVLPCPDMISIRTGKVF